MYNSEKRKAYGQTEKGRRSNIIGLWKFRGVVGDLHHLYDNFYINEKYCWVCSSEFKSSKDRCMDHDHETGDFRQTICQRCNRCDNWKNYFEDV